MTVCMPPTFVLWQKTTVQQDINAQSTWKDGGLFPNAVPEVPGTIAAGMAVLKKKSDFSSFIRCGRLCSLR